LKCGGGVVNTLKELGVELEKMALAYNTGGGSTLEVIINGIRGAAARLREELTFVVARNITGKPLSSSRTPKPKREPLSAAKPCAFCGRTRETIVR
jgi:hypothetical protein